MRPDAQKERLKGNMEKRDEVLRIIVLRGVADDFESLEKISEDVYTWVSQCSLKFSRSGILKALTKESDRRRLCWELSLISGSAGQCRDGRIRGK